MTVDTLRFLIDQANRMDDDTPKKVRRHMVDLLAEAVQEAVGANLEVGWYEGRADDGWRWWQVQVMKCTGYPCMVWLQSRELCGAGSDNWISAEQVVEQHHVGAAAAEEGAHDFGREILTSGFAAFEVDEQHRALGRVLRRIVHARAQLLDLGPDAHRSLSMAALRQWRLVYYINDWKSINIARSRSMARRP